ncbi:helix-turn-helix domain-containing protein [Candidatus Poriferisodalis sp.]|uniref:helix-turn-helix domain-containing protein n=1 Tax=Candidatus Poriferisodalis sp. TaxID=3101277 RepID=UPI003C6F85FB
MTKPSRRSPEQKLQVVLGVLRGEQSAAEAGRKFGVSEQSVHNWKRILVESGREGLTAGRRRRTSREAELEAEYEELKAALGEAHAGAARVAKGGGLSPPVGDLDVIRAEAGMPITRFAALIGVPRRTCQYRLATHRAGDPPKGPWPAPVVDRIEPAVAKLAAEWPAWGHRKIWAMGRHAGWEFGSQSSVRRAMARRGLLGPVRCQAERRQLARARRAAFADAPSRPNRAWQADLSEFETEAAGTRQLGGVADYAAKLVLACPVGATGTAGDLCAAFDAAETRASELLGHALIEDCTDGDTGEVTPVVIVTDNGPATKSAAVARWFAARAHFAHVRTRHRSPHTNGVTER